nr:hypothetical protein [Tanacetum cinerariifolium]
MANFWEDIQCVGFDTRPPMLDRTDFASWQQRIRLYCRGTEGALHLGPERPRVYSDLTSEEKDMYNADIRATNILLQRLPNDIYSLINHYINAKDIWDNVKMLLEGVDRIEDMGTMHRVQVQLVIGELRTESSGQDNVVDDNVDEQPIQDLALNTDDVFQADDCDAFDFDVNEAPTLKPV